MKRLNEKPFFGKYFKANFASASFGNDNSAKIIGRGTINIGSKDDKE